MTDIAKLHNATEYRGAQLRLIKQTIAKDLNDQEFDMFINVCSRVGLDPFRKQIYATVYNKKDKEKRSVVFTTSVDGFRAIAARNGDYRPDENEPEVIYQEGLAGADNPRGIEKAVVTVWKKSGGEWSPIKGVARWEEFAPIEEDVEWRDTGKVWQDSGKPKKEKKFLGTFKLDEKAKFWRKMPAHMLAKCAEVQALRKGWPEDLSGMYAHEEMAQADLDERTATEIVQQEEEDRRIRAIGGARRISFVMNAGDPLEPIDLGNVADRCLAYIKEAEHPLDLEKWAERNRTALKEFWARDPGDALAVKAELEAKMKKMRDEG